MRKLLKNKQGLTLIEVIVGSLLFGLVAITVFTVIAPMMQAFMISNDLAEYNMVLDSVGNKITSEIAQASEVTPVANGVVVTTDAGDTYYYVDGNGVLRRTSGNIPGDNDEFVFQPGFYRGKSAVFEVIGDADSPLYTVNVTVSSTGGRAASSATRERAYTVRSLLIMSNNQ